MRPDMSEVVIERPRARSRYNFHDARCRYKGIDIDKLDDLPKHQGYRRAHVLNGDTKEFSDLIGPLHRFLLSKVGQKWDDVHSEICEHINPSSTVQIHILGHVFQFIETDCFMGEDGKIYYMSRYGGPRLIGYGDLYVHPETGVIAKMPDRRRGHSPGYNEAAEHLRGIFGSNWYDVVKTDRSMYHDYTVTQAAKNHVRVGFEKELHKMDGIWYWAVFKDVPPPFSQAWFDATSGERKTRTIARGACDYWTGRTLTEGRYRAGRQQASRRDLRRHGLRNDR